jgi:hypothetical protein
MKIRSHSESHIVELEDGTQWRIFPGDIDVTLGWVLFSVGSEPDHPPK